MAKKFKIVYNRYAVGKKKIYTSKAYKKWRKAVFKRDLYICRFCLKKSCYVEAHHIVKKSTSPRLMFVVANGITLCKSCHRKVTGSERRYANFFRYLIQHKIFTLDGIQKQKRLISGPIRN